MSDSLPQKQLLEFFSQEFDERTTMITNNLLEMDNSDSDHERIRIILRELHGLKGSSKMVGLTDVSEIVHKWEDLFKDVQSGKVSFSDEILNLSLLITDQIAEEVKKKLAGENDVMDYAGPAAEIEHIRKGGAVRAEADKPESVSPEQKAQAKTVASESDKIRTSISVPLTKINALMDSLGMIIIKDNFLINVEKRLEYLSELIKKSNNKKDFLMDLQETLVQISRETQNNKYFLKDLKQEILSLKMIPVSHLADKFPRMVYDISKELGKKINFQIEGGDAEVEAEVFQRVMDPLLHLIRNSMDHGIEPPEERIKIGKNETGTITLAFEQTPDYFIIRCRDDGHGLSRSAIAKKAIEMGYLSDKDEKNLTDNDIFYFIFNMGFSTRTAVSELSGRGIGLDVVKKVVVDELKGKIEINNNPGAGLELALFIPLTLSIIRVLLFVSCDKLFAVPLESIKGIFSVSKMPLKKIKQTLNVEYDNAMIPVFSFSDVVGLNMAKEEEFVIILEHNFARCALLAEEIIEQIESVLKRFNPPVSNSPLYEGGVLLGNGKLVPVIDVKYFSMTGIDLSKKFAKKETVQEVKKRIIVVEDSLTTRVIEKNLLKEIGYDVDEASNGEEALEKIVKGEYDVVFSDVQMPKMDGIGLLKSLRRRRKTKNIPFIFVSTLDSKQIDAEIRNYQGFIKKRDFTLQRVTEILKGIFND